MSIALHFRPHTHRRFLRNVTTTVRLYSSSDDNNQNRISPSKSQYSFTDVKNTLKTTQNTRTPSFHNPNPSTREYTPKKFDGFEELRKSLLKLHPELLVKPQQSSAPVMSLQEPYQRKLDDTGLNYKLRALRFEERLSEMTGKGNVSNEAKAELVRSSNENNKVSWAELNERLRKVPNMGLKEILGGELDSLFEMRNKLLFQGATKKKEVPFLLHPPKEVLDEKAREKEEKEIEGGELGPLRASLKKLEYGGQTKKKEGTSWLAQVFSNSFGVTVINIDFKT